jgi:hypothetical protein
MVQVVDRRPPRVLIFEQLLVIDLANFQPDELPLRLEAGARQLDNNSIARG